MSASSIKDLSDQVGPIRPLRPDEIAAARRHAAAHAHDAEDLALLLDVMGVAM